MRRLRLDEKVDLLLSPRVSFRVYADSRPHMLQASKLQKGAIIVCDGTELVEEGLGIGVPVCKYKDGTYFSLSADTFVDDSKSNSSVVKIYDMNGIASKRFRGVPIRRGGYLAGLLKFLEKGYRGLRRFRVNATLGLDLLSSLGMTNEYLASRPKGRVKVSYRANGTGLRIDASFEELSQEGLQGVVFANEQSGRLFSNYTDSTGTKLHGKQIEPWQTTKAEWASVYSQEFGVGFTLHRPSRWFIVRGRELVKDRISWSGLDLVCKDIPRALEYRVEIAGDAAVD